MVMFVAHNFVGWHIDISACKINGMFIETMWKTPQEVYTTRSSSNKTMRMKQVVRGCACISRYKWTCFSTLVPCHTHPQNVITTVRVGLKEETSRC